MAELYENPSPHTVNRIFKDAIWAYMHGQEFNLEYSLGLVGLELLNGGPAVDGMRTFWLKRKSDGHEFAHTVKLT